MERVVGIIAEYNPFHNGHAYHLQEAKKIANANYSVVVMSGNFTQRGDTSIVDKWTKTYMALCGGADLVLELPTVYSTSSAENFASGAIKLFESLKIVDCVAFGTETDDLATLNNVANVLNDEPRRYVSILNHELRKGLSFPEARENALMMYLNDISRYANVLKGSNNILGIEYLKAMKRQKSTIEPIAVKRQKVYYNDNKIIDDLASSTGIRKLLEGKEFKEIRKVVPKATYQILEQNYKKGNVVPSLAKFEKEIIYKLRTMSVAEIAELPDVSEGLENLIKDAASSTNCLVDFMAKVKSKRYTQTRIQRILVHALLGINKKMMEESKRCVPYARVLGFNTKGKQLMAGITRANPKIEMITSVKKYLNDSNKKQRPNKALLRMLSTDMLATDIYTIGFEYESNANLDYTHNMIMIK